MIAVYSGVVFFLYLPVFKYLASVFGNTALNALVLSIYMWTTWLSKPIFGYLCDYYPILNRQITPYLVIGCLINLSVLCLGAALDLSQNKPAAFIIIAVSFLCFSMIDSIARRCSITAEGMTNITMELELRHKRLKPDYLRQTDDLLVGDEEPEQEPEQKRYSRNFGFYITTRYAGRMISIAFSIYYLEKVSLNRLFAGFSCLTLALLLFILCYFHELKVS